MSRPLATYQITMKSTIQFPFILEDEIEITIEATIEEDKGDRDTPPVLPWVHKLETIPANASLSREDWQRAEDRALEVYADMI